MRYSALFVIALAISSAVAVKTTSSIELAMKSQLATLEKTGWGQVAMAFISLQNELGGPLDELVQAFKSLLSDLNFKINTERQDYAEQLAEHKEIDRQINGRIKGAEMDIGVQTHKLENFLYPKKADLETAIANDNALIATTKHNMELATTERAANAEAYKVNVQEHKDAIEAVGECLSLIEELMNPNPSLMQVTKAQNHLKKLVKHLKNQNLIKVLIELAQNFSDQNTVKKVLNLLREADQNLHDSLGQSHTDEELSIKMYGDFMVASADTITKAEARIVINTEDLNATDKMISESETFRASRKADLAIAQTDLEVETNRWDKITAIHEDLMAQLQDELAAVNDCINVFANFNPSGALAGSLNK